MHDRTPPDKKPAPTETISFGPFLLVIAERLLIRAARPVPLGGRAMDILVTLLERPGRVVSKEELMDRVWPNLTVEEGTLRFHIAGLRKVLGRGHSAARYVENVHGRGYCFVAPVSRSSPAR
jgi:DNA-binding winged helix-turn-helix (wHTH) protein